jgi:hypothetical protein
MFGRNREETITQPPSIMDVAAIKPRVESLLSSCAVADWSMAHQAEVYHGTLSILQILYGKGSSQERDLRTLVETIGGKTPHNEYHVSESIAAIRGVLATVKAELDAGLIGSLTGIVAGEVLTDLLKLARAVLQEPGDDAKNVGAVLAAAAFEDTIRRFAYRQGIPHDEKLADLLTKLKDSGLLKGAQVGIAQSYLSFRNRALHAKWADLDRSAVNSVLGFTEQFLLENF